MCRGDSKPYLRFRYVEISAPALPAYRYQNIAICGTGTVNKKNRQSYQAK
jgi:hypothetical protein